MNLHEFLKCVLNDAQLKTVPPKIQELNFELSKKCCSLSLFETLDKESKQFEYTMKSYFLGVLTDNKEIRVKSLKKFKNLQKDVIWRMKSFKQSYEDHRKKCKKEQNHKES